MSDDVDVGQAGPTTDALRALGFSPCHVKARRLNIEHPDPTSLGPFCRLGVEGGAPLSPGVYAWVIDGEVMYVGKAGVLRQIVRGASMGRAYNDYTYVPASKVKQTSSPRVRVNGLLSRSLCEGSDVRWWWVAADSAESAARLEGQLIARWQPPWNRAQPVLV